MIGTIEAQRGTLRGSISTGGSLHVALINSKVSPVGVVCIPSLAPIDAYTGSYDIVPAVESQVMNTAGKRMTDDVQIQAIPYYEVSNADGLTIIIGG